MEEAWYNPAIVTIPTLHSVDVDACRTCTGVECLPADLRQALGDVPAGPCALSDPLLCWASGQDAGLWPASPDRLPRVSLSGLRARHARGGAELHIVAVLTLCQSVGGQLAESGQQSPARRRDLSSHHPDGAGDVPHNVLPACGSRVERVHALWRPVSG